ncbi:MAG: PH domain-containing protein, partial [Candidatus Binatia bacterium]
MSIETEWSGTPSWWKHFGRLAGAVLLTAAAGALQISQWEYSQWEYKGMGAGVLALIALILFLSACWSKFSNRFHVSSGRVSTTYGLLSQETHEVDVVDIRDIVLKQSLAG